MRLWRPPLGSVVAGFAAAFAIVFVASGISPVQRDAWLLENLLAVAAVALLAGTYRRFPLSRLSYTLIFVFLCLHEIGAHYTYSLVPYDAWWQAAFGHSLDEAAGFQRNHFDRAIHFSYGLLLAYPVREFYVRVVDARGLWGYLLPLGFVTATSAVYELLEWGAAVLFGGDLGQAYLGTQGDEWDAHWDMLLAALGATIAMGATLLVNVSLSRDFAREWHESLRVKHEAPLGEEALARMTDDE